MDQEYPIVPDGALASGAWTHAVTSEETIFRTPMSEVIGRTVLYEDAALRELLAPVDPTSTGRDGAGTLVATDGVGITRFFFATALTFRPPLAPGVGAAAVRPTVARRARRAFAEDLRARGCENVQEGRRQRVRTDAGDRAGLWKVTATLPLAGQPTWPDELGVEGWLAVWAVRGAFRIAGGCFPRDGLADLLAAIDAESTPVDTETWREDLLSLIRSVG